MRIRQAVVSSAISSFARTFRRKFGLGGYSRPDMPCVFFGCYGGANGRDINRILRHAGMAVVVWGGSDAMNMRSGWGQRLRRPNVFHIAISKHVVDDLEWMGLPYYFVPICPTDTARFMLQPLGTGIYVYSSHARPEVYGWGNIQRLMKRMPDVKWTVGHATPQIGRAHV